MIPYSQEASFITWEDLEEWTRSDLLWKVIFLYRDALKWPATENFLHDCHRKASGKPA